MSETTTKHYKVVDLFGNSACKGTFDCIYDQKKYKTMKEAETAQDYVVINFVVDGEGTKYFEAYHTKNPDHKLYKALGWQDPRFGLDVADDNAGLQLAEELL